MILILAALVRGVFHLGDLISERHLDALARMLLASVMVVILAYLYEHFLGWYSADPFERLQNLDRISGPFAKLFWPAVALQVGVPQLLW
jgi:cation transporter-like permease